MSKFVLRYFFEYGAGGCLWAANEETYEKLGSGPVDSVCYDQEGSITLEPRVALSDVARSLRDKLDFEHSGYLNPVYPPDPSLWTQNMCERFNLGVDQLLELLKQELGSEYEIRDEQPRLAEDPELGEYLESHPELSAIENVTNPTVR